MEYLIPALIVVGAGAVVGGAAWWISRRASSGASPESKDRAGGPGNAAARCPDASAPENARAASGRPWTRRPTARSTVSIAAGGTSDAVTAYRRSTGLGTFESMLDVQALATFPQMWTKPGAASAGARPTPATPGVPRPARPSRPASAAAPAPAREPGRVDDQELLVPLDWVDEKPLARRPF